jgi:hypothetical protein
MSKIKVETLKLTGWISAKHLKNVKILTSKPKKGKFVEILIEFVPITKKRE